MPTLAEIWRGHEHRRLVDMFVGGGAVALGLRPTSALINDKNTHLINFYRQLQKGLVVELRMENDGELYYKHRAYFNELACRGSGETPEAAALFYYLNRTGFNGLCRFNSKGLFNVPFGKYKAINYLKDFTPYTEVLAGWELSCADFGSIDLKPGDFVYADPPYDVEFTTYSPGGFSWQSQEELAELLAKHRGPVVASNQATERVLKLYKKLGFHIELLEAPRMISCNGDRTPASEMLATKGI